MLYAILGTLILGNLLFSAFLILMAKELRRRAKTKKCLICGNLVAGDVSTCPACGCDV